MLGQAIGCAGWSWQKQHFPPPWRPVSALPFVLDIRPQCLSKSEQERAFGEGPGCSGGEMRHC